MNCKVGISPLSDIQLDDLMVAWRTLELSGDGSFFQSSLWVGCWVSSLKDISNLYLLDVHNNGLLVALGIFGRTRETRHRVLTSETMSLFETGNPNLDTLTVEHNDLLVRRGWERKIWGAALDAFLQHRELWEEIRVSGISSGKSLELIEKKGRERKLIVQTEIEKPYYWVDLAEVREKGGEYLSLLSKNTRYQIRRAIKIYNKRGDLCIEQADTEEKAKEYFDSMSVLHQRYWNGKGERGAFSSDFNVGFHKNLIVAGLAAGSIQLLSITSGSRQIGYLYNFIYGGRVVNYQSGFVYENNPKLKPGLVCHKMAIQKNLEEGMDVYDFLMGSMQYKKSLSLSQGKMNWISVQSRKTKFALERMAKRVKSHIV